MQQHPGDRTSRSTRGRRTQPALPGVTLPTTPVTAPSQRNTPLPQPPVKKRPRSGRRAAFRLTCLGLLLALFSLAMYPLLAGTAPANDAAKQALFGIFPWLPRLFWTTWAPFLVQGLDHIALFNLAGGASSTRTGGGNANLLLVLFALSFALLFVAARIGAKVARERLPANDGRLLFWTVFVFTGMLGIIFVFAPAVQSRDVFLYGAYGRMVTVYHINPYVVSPQSYLANLLYALIPRGTGVAAYGPLWIDLTLPVVVAARESVANIMIGFRLVALVAHLANTLLIWMILARLRSEVRISGTLLYAWNPLLLLLGVCEMHYELVVVFLVLLAAFFCERKAYLPGWICILLAALSNILCLLLLPLFLRFLWKETRLMGGSRRPLWWLALVSLSAAVVVLAFAPYWQGWGFAGIVSSLRSALLQDRAVNSLDASILYMPMGPPPFLAWIATPSHWMIPVAVIVGGLLLLGVWLVDTLELVLLFSSWILLALVALLPVNWPWYALMPLALAVASASRRTTLLAMLFAMGAVIEYYFWLWPQVWMSLALVSVGLPLLVWGWTLFITSTWHMTRTGDTEQPLVKQVQAKGLSFSRPSWPSRPSRPGRRK